MTFRTKTLPTHAKRLIADFLLPPLPWTAPVEEYSYWAKNVRSLV